MPDTAVTWSCSAYGKVAKKTMSHSLCTEDLLNLTQMLDKYLNINTVFISIL